MLKRTLWKCIQSMCMHTTESSTFFIVDEATAKAANKQAIYRYCHYIYYILVWLDKNSNCARAACVCKSEEAERTSEKQLQHQHQHRCNNNTRTFSFGLNKTINWFIVFSVKKAIRKIRKSKTNSMAKKYIYIYCWHCIHSLTPARKKAKERESV